MDKIIKKDIVNGVEYKYNGIGGGGSITENNVIYISQADYDNLTPAEKADATKNYVIIGEGGIPVPTDINAEDVDFDNTGTGMTADNVQDAIEEVFQSVSNGKELLADAITGKGVSTSATDSFQTMASNISSLDIATEGQIVAYNMAHGGKGNLLFSLTGAKDSSGDGQNLLFVNGIGGEDYEYYFIGLRTSNNSSEDYRYTPYKFYKNGTYQKIDISVGANVSDRSDARSPNFENWYIYNGDNTYRYAIQNQGNGNYKTMARFNPATGEIVSDTTITSASGNFVLSNTKTTLPYTVTSESIATMYGDVHVFNILARF